MSWDTASVYGVNWIEDLTTRVRRLERGRQYYRNGVLVSGSSDLSPVPSNLLDDNRLNLASSGLVTAGSIPPTGFSGKFGFTATTTSITIYWDGTNGSTKFSRLGTDGTVIQVPGGSMTISGLTANTLYGFLPYWSAYNNCGLGWIVGDSGAPKFAFTAAAQTAVATQQQALIGREPVTSGFITYSTPASGTSSGGGGGGRECVMVGTDIETLGDIEYTTEHHPQTEWIHIQAQGVPRSLYCTPDHPLYHADKGKQPASEFVVSDWIITDMGERRVVVAQPHTRVCVKIKVCMPFGHLFWANGYLSHNMKIFVP